MVAEYGSATVKNSDMTDLIGDTMLNSESVYRWQPLSCAADSHR